MDRLTTGQTDRQTDRKRHAGTYRERETDRERKIEIYQQTETDRDT